MPGEGLGGSVAGLGGVSEGEGGRGGPCLRYGAWQTKENMGRFSMWRDEEGTLLAEREEVG